MTILVAYAPRPEGEAALEKGIEAATRRNERLIVVNAAVGGPQEDPNIVSGHDAERLEQRLQGLSIPAEFKMFVRGHNAVEEIKTWYTASKSRCWSSACVGALPSASCCWAAWPTIF